MAGASCPDVLVFMSDFTRDRCHIGAGCPSHRSFPCTWTEVSLAYGLNSCHLTYEVQLQKAVVFAQFNRFNTVRGERRILYHTFVAVVNRIEGDNYGAPRILGYVMG